MQELVLVVLHLLCRLVQQLKTKSAGHIEHKHAMALWLGGGPHRANCARTSRARRRSKLCCLFKFLSSAGEVSHPLTLTLTRHPPHYNCTQGKHVDLCPLLRLACSPALATVVLVTHSSLVWSASSSFSQRHFSQLAFLTHVTTHYRCTPHRTTTGSRLCSTTRTSTQSTRRAGWRA